MDSVMKQKWEYSVFCCILVFPLKWRSSAVILRHNYTRQNYGDNCSKTTPFSQSHFLHCHLQYDISSNYWEAVWICCSRKVFMACSNLEVLTVYSIRTCTMYKYVYKILKYGKYLKWYAMSLLIVPILSLHSNRAIYSYMPRRWFSIVLLQCENDY